VVDRTADALLEKEKKAAMTAVVVINTIEEKE